MPRASWLAGTTRIAGAALLAALVGGCSEPAAPSQGGPDSTAVAALQQTVVAQQAQLAAQRDQAAAQQVQIAGLRGDVAALQTAVAAPRSNPTAGPKPAAPAIPTVIPPVAGIPTSDTTKGVASAKVTLTEYSDFQ